MADKQKDKLIELTPEQIDCGLLPPSFWTVGKPDDNIGRGHAQSGATEAERQHLLREVASNGGLTGGTNIADRPPAPRSDTVAQARADVGRKLGLSKRKDNRG